MGYGKDFGEENSTAYLLNIKTEKEELVYTNNSVLSVYFSINKYNDKHKKWNVSTKIKNSGKIEDYLNYKKESKGK